MSTFTISTEISMNTDTDMNLYQITTEQIATAARTAYPNRKVSVGFYGRIVYISPNFCVGVYGDGVGWGINGTGTECVEWEDPNFERDVAAGISELVGEPFPADWMEQEVPA